MAIPVLLSYTLTPALALSCPMISTENAITATSPGTTSTRSSRSRLSDIKKKADPILLITRRDDGTWEGGRKFILRVNRVLGWNHVCDTSPHPKKRKWAREKVKKKKRSFDFLSVFPTCVADCPSDVLKENINLYEIRFHAVIEA